jgi:hypothetical protein
MQAVAAVAGHTRRIARGTVARREHGVKRTRLLPRNARQTAPRQQPRMLQPALTTVENIYETVQRRQRYSPTQTILKQSAPPPNVQTSANDRRRGEKGMGREERKDVASRGSKREAS